MKSIRVSAIVQITLLVIGITALAFGLYLGEATEILHKAIIVCMECIGIG